MTDPKDTATTQTMRAHLRQHGLPEAWAEWVREIAIERRDQFESFTFTVRREDVVTVRRPKRPQLSTPGGAPRTDDEMVKLWTEYGKSVAEWIAKYGNAECARVSVESGLPTNHTAKLTGSGASLTLTAIGDRGPWRAAEWTARPSGRGLSMIESLLVEWFDAEGWMKRVPLPTGTSGMVQGADGWEYPAAAQAEMARCEAMLPESVQMTRTV